MAPSEPRNPTPESGRTTPPKRVRLTLVGLDGNAFALLGAFQRQARREGWTREEIKAVIDGATASDYQHLLRTLGARCEEREGEDDGDSEEP